MEVISRRPVMAPGAAAWPREKVDGGLPGTVIVGGDAAGGFYSYINSIARLAYTAWQLAS